MPEAKIGSDTRAHIFLMLLFILLLELLFELLKKFGRYYKQALLVLK